MKIFKILLPVLALILASSAMADWTDAPPGCSGPGVGCPNTPEPLNVGKIGNPDNVTQEGNNKYVFFQPITIANKLLDTLGLAGTVGQVLTSTIDGPQWMSPGSVPNPGPGGSNLWTASGNDIYNGNSGNVGIGGVPSGSGGLVGNLSADKLLDVFKPSWTNGEDVQLRVGDLFFNSRKGGSAEISSLSARGGNGNLLIGAQGNANQLWLTTSGNVGIGVVPTSKLTIGGVGNLEFQNADQSIIASAGDSQRARITPRDLTTGDMILAPGNAGGVQRDVVVQAGNLRAPSIRAASICTTDSNGNTVNCLGGGSGSPAPAPAPAPSPSPSEPNRFGGMYRKFTAKNAFDLLLPDCVLANPMTGSCDCPSGFQAVQIYEYGNYPSESKQGVSYCWK